jgi:uncharacterized SAM-binding protein YcdF (DUF218 family)
VKLADGMRPRAADAIVVLGGGIEPGGRPSLVSRTRVERAVEIFRGGVAPRIILSGRCGLTDREPAVTEAAAMADHARSIGVPDGALVLEEESRDTLGNAYFTRARFLEPNGWTSVRVVTSDFHLSRAAWVFRKILGGAYDFAFVSAASGLSPRELIFRALEECKLSIFLNEWLQALQEGDAQAIERLMLQEHPGYADAPTLSHDEMRRRLDEIAHINRIAGTQHWIATGGGLEPADAPVAAGERRRGRERRTIPPQSRS